MGFFQRENVLFKGFDLTLHRRELLDLSAVLADLKRGRGQTPTSYDMLLAIVVQRFRDNV